MFPISVFHFVNLFFLRSFVKNLQIVLIWEAISVGNFFGQEDGWKNDETKTFVNKEKIDAIFKDFDIVYFNERKYSKENAAGRMKFWHVYDVIAKKVK